MIKASLPANLLAILLAALSITFYVEGGQVGLGVQFVLGLFVIPAALLFLFDQVDIPKALRGIGYAAALSCGFLISILTNLPNYMGGADLLYTTGLVLSVLFITIITAIVVAAPPEILKTGFATYAVIGTLFLLYIIATETTPGVSRQIPAGIHPNWWGLQSFGIMAAALFTRKKSLRFLIWLICIYMLYLVSARGALLSGILIIGMRMLANIKQTRKVWLTVSLIAFCALLFMMALLLLPQVKFLHQISNFILYDVFLINNTYRGLGTGLVGRVSGYIQAFEEWVANPLFGIGYNNSRETHNGFLMILTETGLCGFSVFMVLLFKAFQRATSWMTNPYIISMLGYLTIMLTYPRAINVNAATLVFLFCLWHELGQKEEAAS